MGCDQKCVTITSVISSEHSCLSSKKHFTSKDCTPTLTSGLSTGEKSRLKSPTQAPSDGKKPICSCSLRGGRKREGEEERFFSKQPLSLAITTWGKDKLRAVWVGEQTEKCLSGTWKQAIWSEGPRDRAWGESFWGWGRAMSCADSKAFPALPCLWAPACQVAANKQHGEGCQEKWQGCLWVQEVCTDQAGQGHWRSPPSLLGFLLC